MSEYIPEGVKPTDSSTELEQRDVRALTECMSVLPEGGDIYTVVGENGATYRVDSREGRCTCPDHKHREARCKHLRRVAYATGEMTIPEWCNVNAVDSHIGEHTDATPKVAATDGGMATVEGDAVDTEDDTDTDEGRPDDCDCGEWCPEDLPCWPCFREGFEEPATEDAVAVEDDGRQEPTRSEPADFGGGETTGVQEL